MGVVLLTFPFNSTILRDESNLLYEKETDYIVANTIRNPRGSRQRVPPVFECCSKEKKRLSTEPQRCVQGSKRRHITSITVCGCWPEARVIVSVKIQIFAVNIEISKARRPPTWALFLDRPVLKAAIVVNGTNPVRLIAIRADVENQSFYWRSTNFRPCLTHSPKNPLVDALLPRQLVASRTSYHFG